MAKKVKEIKEATPEPKKIYVEPIEVYEIHNDPTKLKVAGWVFGWQNIDLNKKVGWGIYRPVLRDSELGEEIARQLGLNLAPERGMDIDNNYFHFGSDLVLGYTSEVLYAKKQADAEKAADRAMASIGPDVSITRHTVIDNGPPRS